MAAASARRRPAGLTRVKRWHRAVVVNAYRGLCLLILGASPVLVRVALATPVRAALVAGASLACWRSAAKVARLWSKLPIPDAAREAIAADCARFGSLTAKGPIFRAGVRLAQRIFDCQTAPLAPARLRATVVRSSSATLAWTPTVASWLSDEAYRLELALSDRDCSEPADGAWRTVYDGPALSHELRGLSPHAVYACRVRAHNGKGESAARLERFLTEQLPTARRGGTAPAYSWAQDAREVVVRVPVPAGTRAADLAVSCSATHVRAALTGAGGGGEARVLLAGALARPADPSEFAWQFVDADEADEREAAARGVGGRVVELTIAKARASPGQLLWPSVVCCAREPVAAQLAHPRIDTSVLIGVEAGAAAELGGPHLRELMEMATGSAL